MNEQKPLTGVPTSRYMQVRCPKCKRMHNCQREAEGFRCQCGSKFDPNRNAVHPDPSQGEA